MNRFVIHQKLPSLNEVIGANRGNKYMGAGLKRQVQKDICDWITVALMKNTLYPVDQCEMFIIWHEKTKRRDADNIQSAQKFILDSMVEMHIIKDDSRRYVTQINHKIVDDTEDYVEVYLQ